MRTISAAVACVLLAFGAAFLVTRAVDHGGSARAATQARLPALPAATVPAQGDPALAAQFTPQRVSLRRPAPKARSKPRSHPVSPASQAAAVPSTPAAATQTQPTETQPAYTAPAYTAPAYTSPSPVTQAPSTPTTTHHSTTAHHSSGSGSGTTVIGG
jgi:hypothetical protein